MLPSRTHNAKLNCEASMAPELIAAA